MATITIPLKDGVTIGDKKHMAVVMRELTPGDIIDAGMVSERAVQTADGYIFAVSPTLMGMECLARQIESIGDYDGVVELSDLRRFSREDFEIIQMEAENLDQTVLEAVMQRGRSDTSADKSGTADD